jgi:carboxylesterase type B
VRDFSLSHETSSEFGDILFRNPPNSEMKVSEFGDLRIPVGRRPPFFHGGGWISGHGGYSLYPPEKFMENDVVLVTGNYRLGPLGFLSFEDKECNGNFGMKDQALMLQWVKMNIDKFGGDSGSVTIFGQSAGGASVNLHMISPMSKGLFERAISHSGSLMNFWADMPRPGLAKMRGIRLAEMMGCPIMNTNYKKTVECLRKVDAEKITAANSNFYVSCKYF